MKRTPLTSSYRMVDVAKNQRMVGRFRDSKNRELDGRRKSPDVIITGDKTLTQWHLGKILLFEMDGDMEATLPEVDSSDLYTWITVFRLGQDGRLLIRAAGSDKIEYSSAPGRIWCNEEKRLAANLTLQVVSANQWGITAGTGIWKVA